HLEIERGDALDAHVAGHLLVLEGLAGILAAAGRAVRAVRDRHAVGGTQAGEVPALHRTGEALADGGAGDIDELPDNKMVGGDFSADRNQLVLCNTELGKLALGLDLGRREIAAVGFSHVVALARARAKLNGDVAVLVLGAMRDHLAVGEAEHRHRHVLAAVGKDARHPDFLCDDPGTHLASSFSSHLSQSLISTSTPAARSSFISASTVCGVGSTMSSSRLWVRISNCSRLF